MAKLQTANYREFQITLNEDGKVTATKSNQDCSNVKETLREISKLSHFAFQDTWTTRQFGQKLVAYLNAIKQIREVMTAIATQLKPANPADPIVSYNQQREMINMVFKAESGRAHDKGTIMLRLIVIESLYSTNAGYNYFSFEDMAEKLASRSDEDVAKYFNSLITGKKEEDKSFGKDFFNGEYGIAKNTYKGSKQPSLISKYVYYLLLQNKKDYPLGFPIFDSLAIKTYPQVCKFIGIKPQNISQKSTIEEYISALDDLRKTIFGSDNNDLFEGMQQFDILDAYLWRMGKINKGNFSLLLSKDDYIKFIQNLGLNREENVKPETYIREIHNKYGKYDDDKKKIFSIKRNKPEAFNFNKLVKLLIATMSVDEVTKDMESKDYITMLINHWKLIYNIQ